MEELPADLRRTFVVAGDITPEWHLKAQAAFQKYTDNAISKTINFNNEATVQDVRDAYWLAYESGCKGITIYRDGSRQKQILEVKKEGSYYDQLAGKKMAVGDPALEGMPIEMKPRPDVLAGHTYKVPTPIGTAFVSINTDDSGDIFEVFVNLGRAGSDIMADAEAMGRLISLAFRIPSVYSSDRIAQNVVEQLSGIGGSSSAGFGPQRVRSLADAVAKVLREHEASTSGQRLERTTAAQLATAGATVTSSLEVADAPMTSAAVAAPVATAAAASVDMGKVQTDLCPECGNASLRFIEGCQKCEICGFSKC
jgi:ribonucleoside-diphosphate reductase alpha chain